MGSCVSVNKDPESAVELRLSVGSNDDKLLMASTVKPEVNTVNGGGDRAVADMAIKSELSTRFRDAGSKDDTFFDSQPWLESDCEDDFFSVNGDFTPSRGSTPVHHRFSSANPTVISIPVLESSTPYTKKRLFELFKESVRRQHYSDDEENEVKVENVKPEATILNHSKSTNGNIEDKSKGSSEKTTDGFIRDGDGSVKSTGRCCLPSFGERKKKISHVLISG